MSVVSHPHCIILGEGVFTLQKIQNITKTQVLGWTLIIVSHLFVAILLVSLAYFIVALLHNYHKEMEMNSEHYALLLTMRFW